MNYTTHTLLESTAHRQLVCSLYRALIRRTRRLAKDGVTAGEIPLQQEISPPVQLEFKKLQIDPSLYWQNLSAELLYAVQFEFRKPLPAKHYTRDVLHRRLVAGIELDGKLDALFADGSKFVELAAIVAAYRREVHRNDQLRYQYLANSVAINTARNKDMDPLQTKRRETRAARQRATRARRQALDSLREFGALDPKSRAEKLHLAHTAARAHQWATLRRAIHLLQTNGHLPKPSALPYTRPESPGPRGPMERSSFAAVRDAYDWTYIQSVLMPSLEYDINLNQHLHRLGNIVNFKGPFPARVRLNTSGSVPTAYIRMPNSNHRFLQQMATDIKKLVRLSNVLSTWHWTPEIQIPHGMVHRDGTVSTRGSGGFGPEEKFYPKVYYDDLCEQEARWEYLIHNLSSPEDFTDDLNALKKTYLNQWLDPLELATATLVEQLKLIKDKYLLTKELPLQKEQVQELLNAHYMHMVAKYEELLKTLVSKKVFKHSELINPDTQKHTFDYYFKTDKKPIRKYFPSGVPLIERIGMGKTLGDYLQGNYHSFIWGKKYPARFSFPPFSKK